MDLFGLRLRLARIALGLTMEEAAEILNHCYHTQHAYETGLYKVPEYRRKQIAERLGIPLEWLEGEGPTFGFDPVSGEIF